MLRNWTFVFLLLLHHTLSVSNPFMVSSAIFDSKISISNLNL